MKGIVLLAICLVLLPVNTMADIDSDSDGIGFNLTSGSSNGIQVIVLNPSESRTATDGIFLSTSASMAVTPVVPPRNGAELDEFNPELGMLKGAVSVSSSINTAIVANNQVSQYDVFVGNFTIINEYQHIVVSGVVISKDPNKKSAFLKAEDESEIVWQGLIVFVNSTSNFVFYLPNNLGGKKYRMIVTDPNYEENVWAANEVFVPSPSFFGSIEIEKPVLAPGEATDITVTVTSINAQAIAFSTILPQGWTLENVNGSFSKCKNQGELLECVWVRVASGKSEKMTYRITMPKNLVSTTSYYIGGSLMNASGYTIGLSGGNYISVDTVGFFRSHGQDPAIMEIEDVQEALKAWTDNTGDPFVSTEDLLKIANEVIPTLSIPVPTVTEIPLPLPTMTVMPSPFPTTTVTPDLGDIEVNLSSFSPSGFQASSYNSLVASFNVTNNQKENIIITGVKVGGREGFGGIKIGRPSVFDGATLVSKGSDWSCNGEGCESTILFTGTIKGIAIPPGVIKTLDIRADTTPMTVENNLSISIKEVSWRVFSGNIWNQQITVQGNLLKW